ncbi:serine/threonine-protein kinase [Streptomyces sp. NBRC 109706]|uniref:serine/threonine-protein kinase n=1 Tax=Streptomyces sp. NBRC 109706 TaxID=1550035 RepID=UPI00227731AD|nr:serine/threonine-protein kinase [Streptomyces sp. NBRC 109706]
MGPYRLLFRLGAGGMGRVYLGRSPGSRTVAVKLVNAEMLGVPGFRERFAREVAASRSVSGAGTVPVLAADVYAEVPWSASAYVPGPSLAEAVHEHGPLPLPALWRLLAGLAEALDSVHAAGLVHRDLKPSNVLLSLDRPRVIDFGIARAADETGLTRTGTVVGSPGFMSPEQARGTRLSAASDCFSLGAVLAFAATGRSPFGEGSAPELLYRLVHDAPDLGGVPGELAGVLAGCLAKEPGGRPSLAELRARAAAAGAGADADWLPAPIARSIARRAEELLALEGAEEAREQAAAPTAAGLPVVSPPYAATPAPAPWAQPVQPYGAVPSMHLPSTGVTPPPRQGRGGVLVALVLGVVLLASTVLLLVNLGSGDGGSDDEALSTEQPKASRSAENEPIELVPTQEETQEETLEETETEESGSASVVGEWRGSYFCTQGETGLTLTIAPDGDDGRLAATFTFFPLSSDSNAQRGSFAMSGFQDGSHVELEGDHWIDRPGSYLMVDLSGDVRASDPDAMDGRVLSTQSGCSTFSVSR